MFDALTNFTLCGGIDRIAVVKCFFNNHFQLREMRHGQSSVKQVESFNIYDSMDYAKKSVQSTKR
ncbi:hypothetical protein GCM10023262_02760 [Bartonella pachyuromydis]|uniref:Uncharacterized protein n=1 Tax=Bartonella pachyuromydis TaxID=931097 RepID=A0ABP8VC40_9HYPH